jgi:hypothetical protein
MREERNALASSSCASDVKFDSGAATSKFFS